MAISLTKEALLDRLCEPKRIKLLRLALVRDAQEVALPVYSEAEPLKEFDLCLPVAVGILAETYLLRAIQLAYEELD
jgi:hypothetical protein